LLTMQIGSSGAGINKYGLDIWYDGDARGRVDRVLAEIVRFFAVIGFLLSFNQRPIHIAIHN
jgi:hypothetical protein